MPAPAASALQTQSPRGGEQTAKLELEIVSRAKREPKVRREGGSRSGGAGQGNRPKQEESEAAAEAGGGTEGQGQRGRNRQEWKAER